MLKKLRSSLLLKLNLIIVILFIVAMAVSTYSGIRRESENLTLQIEDKGEMIALSFAEFGEYAIENNEYEMIRNAMTQLMAHDEEVRYMVLVDKTGKAFAHTDPTREGRVFNDSVGIKAAASEVPLAQLYKKDTGEMLYDMSAPVKHNGKLWGAVRLGIPVETVDQAIRQATVSGIITTAVILAVAVLVVSLILRTILGPVRLLMEVTETVAQGDFTRQIEINSTDEIGRLSRSFNTMIGSVKELIGEIMNLSKEINLSGEQLSNNSQEASKAVQQVASAIEDVSKGNNTQTEKIAEIAKTMEQLNEGINQVAAGSQDQSESVQVTSATIDKMAETIANVASNAESVSAGAIETSAVAQKGGQAVKETIDGMERIKMTVFESANKIKELGEYSQQIGAIIQVIDDIAEQTNLLALNAAIEAARAGEHGKGFAVVADEVRKLAERSGKATKEIAGLITGIQNGIENAVGAMEKGTDEVERGSRLAHDAGAALDEILLAIQQSVSQIESISAATQDMAASSDRVVNAINNVATITEETSAATEEMAASIGETGGAVQSIAAVSQQTAAAAQEVNASVEEISASTEEISSSAEQLADMVRRLDSLVGRFTV